jgi:hypothetical protein
MGKKCVACGENNSNYFQIPSKLQTRAKWIKAIHQFCGNSKQTYDTKKEYYLFSFNSLLDISKINDYSVICQKHFKEDCINISGKRNRLIEGAVPSEFVCKDIYNLCTLKNSYGS